MKKIALSLMALGLLQSMAALAQTPTPVPAAIAEHNGPIRIAVIRNLGSDDNTTQFVAGAIQEGKKLGFKVSAFLSNGDDAKFGISSIRPLARNTTVLFFPRGAIPTRPRW